MTGIFVSRAHQGGAMGEREWSMDLVGLEVMIVLVDKVEHLTQRGTTEAHRTVSGILQEVEPYALKVRGIW